MPAGGSSARCPRWRTGHRRSLTRQDRGSPGRGPTRGCGRPPCRSGSAAATTVAHGGPPTPGSVRRPSAATTACCSLSHRTPCHHQVEDLVLVDVLRLTSMHDLALAEDENLVGEPEDLLHLAHNDNNRDPPAPHHPHQAQY